MGFRYTYARNMKRNTVTEVDVVVNKGEVLKPQRRKYRLAVFFCHYLLLSRMGGEVSNGEG